MSDYFESDAQLFELIRSRPENNENQTEIEKNLLINLNQLTFLSKIAERERSIVYEGFEQKILMYFLYGAKRVFMPFIRCLIKFDAVAWCSHGRYKSNPVAINIVHPFNSKCKWKFEREVTMHYRATHDNVVKFIGASVEPAMMIITELMRGVTLQNYLMDMHPNRPHLEESIRFTLGIARAMNFLHSNGIIHRDLKPSNMLISEEKENIKITNFGLAREEIIGEMSTEAGSYRWMAPEMFYKDGNKREMKRYDHKVDVYSFSLVLWELLTNRIPFKGRCSVRAAYAAANNLRPSTEDLPKEIVPLLASCWAEDPAARPEFTQIKLFLEQFLHYLSEPDTTPPRILMNQHASECCPKGRSPCTDHLLKTSEKNKRSRYLACRCFSCLGACLS